jgi:hypothetical protein
VSEGLGDGVGPRGGLATADLAEASGDGAAPASVATKTPAEDGPAEDEAGGPVEVAVAKDRGSDETQAVSQHVLRDRGAGEAETRSGEVGPSPKAGARGLEKARAGGQVRGGGGDEVVGYVDLNERRAGRYAHCRRIAEFLDMESEAGEAGPARPAGEVGRPVPDEELAKWKG